MNRLLRWLRTLSFLSLLLIPVVAGEFCLAAKRRVDAAGDPLPPGIRMRLGSTRLWHRNLDGVRFSSDGKKLLSLGDDALSWTAKKPRVKCRVWDVATGKLLKTLPGSAYPKEKRQYYHEKVKTPDGKSLLIRAWDVIVSRDLATGKIRWRQNVAPQVPGPGLKVAAVNRIAFSPDGRTAAVGSNCGRIVLLDWRTGKYVKGSSRQYGLYKEGMFGAIFDDESVMFSPDSSRLLVADAMTHDDVLLCDARTGKELRRIKGAQILAWSPDGKRLAQSNWGKKGEFLHVTEAATGKELWKIKASPEFTIFSRDGKTITYKEYNGNYYVLDARTDKSRRAFRLPTAKAKDASLEAISPDGKLVAVSARQRKEVQVCSIDGKKIWSKKIPQNWKSWNVRFLGNSRLAFDVAEKKVDSRVVHILDATTGRKQCEIPTGERTYGSILAAAPDGQTIAVKGLKEKRELRDTKTGRVIYTFEPRTARRHELQFSPDGKWCAFNLDDHTIEVRDTATGKLVNQFRRPEHFLRDITFAPDSRTIALTFNDCTVWLWEAIKKQPKQAR